MDFLTQNWTLVLLALTSGFFLLLPRLTGGGGGGLSAAGAVQLINRDKAVVIDICEPTEYAAGHVAGARNVPLSRFEEHLPGVVKNKDTPLVLVCASGMRARRAAMLARKLGYARAEVLTGGLRSWREANLPVERS